jgi:hypothetical protein
MKITWDWSLETEVDRLLQSARNVGNGFYANQGFYPLPWSPTCTYLKNAVYLPPLPYPQITRFWLRVSLLDTANLPARYPAHFHTLMIDALRPLALTSPDLTTLHDQVQLILPRVIRSLHRLVPTLPLPQSILIHPTYFGTTGSFNWMDRTGQVLIYHRIDCGIRYLVECLLTSLLREQAVKKLSATWGETEFLVDWLLDQTELSQIVPTDPSWAGTLSTARTQTSSIIIEHSNAFLQTIGAPLPTTHHFSSLNSQIYFGDKPLYTLTAKEVAIFNALLAAAPKSVSLDQIGDLIFTQAEKYSLAAINKAIERLRKKLNSLGISSSYLATASGVGYYLKN